MPPKFDQLGPYRIGKQLGRGGMGTVYSGVRVDTEEPAAIKVLSAALAHVEGFRERFEAEIESLRKLNHPNIVRLFGFGEQDGHLFYAMELVEGKSLEEELRAGREFDWREVTDLGVQTCRALRHAHDRGVIHRDIKPANLLLAPDGHVKLSDFGIAKLFGHTGMTADGGVLGTAEYMAPEQADGRPVTARCDLYSLGGVLYALLARRPPFRATSLVEMLQLQRFAEPEPVRHYAPATPAELELTLGLLLEKDPDKRIPTAMVLARRLEAMKHGLASRQIEEPPSLPTDEPGNPIATARTATAMQDPPEEPDPTGTEVTKPGRVPLEIPNLDDDDPRASALHMTADLPSKAAKPEAASPAAPSSRFVAVEDEHRHLETADDGYVGWLSWQTLALALALAASLAGIWFVMRPPNADQLYQRIDAVADTEQVERLVEVESDIKTFLDRFPDDPRKQELRDLQEDLELYRLERQFQLRERRSEGSHALTPIERAYSEAISTIRTNPAETQLRLQALLDFFGSDVGQSKNAERCLELARRQLTRLDRQVARQAEDELPLVEKRLAEAKKLRTTNAQAARAMFQNIVVLYGDKPWAADAVRQAREELAK